MMEIKQLKSLSILFDLNLINADQFKKAAINWALFYLRDNPDSNSILIAQLAGLPLTDRDQYIGLVEKVISNSEDIPIPDSSEWNELFIESLTNICVRIKRSRYKNQ